MKKLVPTKMACFGLLGNIGAWGGNKGLKLINGGGGVVALIGGKGEWRESKLLPVCSFQSHSHLRATMIKLQRAKLIAAKLVGPAKPTGRWQRHKIQTKPAQIMYPCGTLIYKRVKYAVVSLHKIFKKKDKTRTKSLLKIWPKKIGIRRIFTPGPGAMWTYSTTVQWT